MSNNFNISNYEFYYIQLSKFEKSKFYAIGDHFIEKRELIKTTITILNHFSCSAGSREVVLLSLGSSTNSHKDPNVASSHTKIDENFANYF